MKNKKVTTTILDKKLLVKFLIMKHLETNKTDISRIKLQKSLYFLFAIWAGFNYEEDDKDSELEKENINTYLYNDATFEAWKYGPVDKKVYYSHLNDESTIPNDMKIKDIEKKLFDSDKKLSQVKTFVESLLNDIFKMSEFDLVERSHLDDVWKNSFNNSKVPGIMKLDDIREEYSKKLKKQF